MQTEWDNNIEALVNRLCKLSESNPDKVKLFPGASIKTIMSATSMYSDFDSELVQFYKQSNGAILYDLVIAGCKNPKIESIKTLGISLWSNLFLASSYISLCPTAGGGEFGILPEIKNSKGSHPIAYITDPHCDSLVVVASSFSKFLENLTTEIEKQLLRNERTKMDTILELPDELDADPRGVVKRWGKVDSELLEMYG